MIFEKGPTLKEFMDPLTEYISDLMSPDGNIMSHTFPAGIQIEDEEGNDYSITQMYTYHLGGCGCPSDIVIRIKKVPEYDYD